MTMGQILKLILGTYSWGRSYLAYWGRYLDLQMPFLKPSKNTVGTDILWDVVLLKLFKQDPLMREVIEKDF